MRTIHVIGVGPGGADYPTAQAVEALRKVDVVFLLDKEGRGKETLTEERLRVLDAWRARGGYRVVSAPSPPRPKAGEDYLDVVADWHERKTAIFGALVAEHLAEGESGAVLVWGDPALYDSTVSILRDLREKGAPEFALDVIPGVTSLQLLAARHAVPLHEVGGEFLVTTARRLLAGAAKGQDSIVVMLDSNAAFARIDPEDFDIYWGAYLGTEREVLMAGPLDRIAAELAETVAALKQRHGWILDVYLLRRRNAKPLSRGDGA